MASTDTLGSYLSRQAALRPDGTAVVMGEERLSYGELDAAANRLARLLADVGCGNGDRVCLFVPKCPAAIVAIQAAVKANVAYVPIDIDSPAARVVKILQSAEPLVLLTTAEAAPLVDDLFATGTLARDLVVGSLEDEPVTGEHFATRFTRADAESFSPEPVELDGRPEDVAHILFTSGSTGIPKGVVITHRMVARFVEWAVDYFGIEASDRNSAHPPLHFDLSTFDIFGTFAAGAELHLVPPSANLIPHKLAELIRTSELTQWFSVPSVLTYMAKFDVVRQDDFPSLERLLWCGEVLPTPTLVTWMQRLPHVTFTNLYGPTEATIASSYHTVAEPPATPTEPIPIGVPCGGEELRVLDEALREVPAGKTGMLYIGGVGLSPGYWRDPEKTAEAFVADPRSPESGARIYRTGDLAQFGEDGLCYFLGRADTQIKSRGYRIELGEIETALNARPELQEAAVVGVDVGGFEGTAICCAYAPLNGREVQPAELRAAVTSVLPSYMIPSRWRAFDQLPKNVNGKIDRKRLKDIFTDELNRPATAA
jgi:amino acid adenylation domain-containing protein